MFFRLQLAKGVCGVFRFCGVRRKDHQFLKAQAAGVDVGTGFGPFFLLGLWAMGDIILGLLYLVASPSNR